MAKGPEPLDRLEDGPQQVARLLEVPPLVDVVDPAADQPLGQQRIGSGGGDDHHPGPGPRGPQPLDQLDAGVDIGADLPSLAALVVHVDDHAIVVGQLGPVHGQADGQALHPGRRDPGVHAEHLTGPGSGQQVVIEDGYPHHDPPSG